MFESIRKPLRGAAATWTGAALILAAAAPAVADVVSSSPAGFAIRIEMPVAAPPADVYARFFEIGHWWSDEHTYSGKATNMALKNEPGACFCEALAGGGFVRHATLEYSDRGKVTRLSGALGPLQELGTTGMLTFNFTPGDKGPAAGGTKLIVTYNVSGYRSNTGPNKGPDNAPDKGLAALAEPVNAVITEQVTRLRQFVEQRKP